jgi:hypothetical protein
MIEACLNWARVLPFMGINKMGVHSVLSTRNSFIPASFDFASNEKTFDAALTHAVKHAVRTGMLQLSNIQFLTSNIQLPMNKEQT